MLQKSVVEAKFKRSKTNLLTTTLWRDLPSFVRKYFEQIAQTIQDDTAILSYWPSPQYSWVIQLNEILIFTGPRLETVKFESICEIRIPSIGKNDFDKNKVDAIELFLKDEKDKNSILLAIENGSWPIIYQILSFLHFHSRTK